MDALAREVLVYLNHPDAERLAHARACVRVEGYKGRIARLDEGLAVGLGEVALAGDPCPRAKRQAERAGPDDRAVGLAWGKLTGGEKMSRLP
jgi:hypothetical protein